MKNKIISLILSFVMILGCVNVFAVSNEAVKEIKPIYDSYFGNGRSADSYEKNQVILAGEVYDRYALVHFDITEAEGVEYKGNLLTLSLRNPAAGTVIYIYSYDPDAKDFKASLELLTNQTIEKDGKQTLDFVVSKYIERLKQAGKTKACFAVSSNANVLPIFASEYGSGMEPKLKFTKELPFIKGQKDFAYPEVTKDMLEKDLSKTISEGHPYLFGRKADFDRTRELVHGGDEYLTGVYAAIKERADKYASEEPDAINIVKGSSYISRGVSGKELVHDCLFVYMMEGDARYAERAWKEVELFCSLDSWGDTQAIDNNQLASTLAFTYDWLYDYLTPERRDLIVKTLKEKHLDEMMDMFRNPKKGEYQDTFHLMHFGASNQAVLDNCSMFMEALAIADVDRAYSAELMAYCLEHLEPAFDVFVPDSAFNEGVGYWSFVGPYIARMFSSMESAFGTWYGYEKITPLVRNSDFVIYAQSSKNSVMFCDAGAVRDTSFEKYYYGKMLGDVSLQKFSMENDVIEYPLFCLWYDSNTDYNSEMVLTKDKLFRNLDMAVMRGPFEGTQEIYGAMTVTPTPGHGGGAYCSAGTVTFDALGEQWTTIPSRDSYSLPGYWEATTISGRRWKYYFSRAEANNCLVINPDDKPGQDLFHQSEITNFASSDSESFAIADLTDAYKENVTSYKRGLMLDSNRTKFILQDEVAAKDKSEIYSFINFNTRDFEITSDNDVIVRKGNKKLYLNIICDQPYEVSIMNCEGLPTSNILPGERALRTMKKVAIRLKDVQKANIRVEIIPYLFDEELSVLKDDTFVPMSEWAISDEAQTNPVLKSLTVGGSEIADFSPYNRCYVVSEENFPSEVTPVVDESLYNVSYTKDLENKIHKIIVTDKNDASKINSYIVCTEAAETAIRTMDVSGLTKLTPKAATATDAQNPNLPANAIDGDSATRWSAQGKQAITFEFSKKVKLNSVGVSWMDGQTRQSYFNLEISNDGRSWETLAEYETSGLTDDMEYYPVGDKEAKYVRLSCFGTSSGQWNSITEVEFYTK